MVCLDEKQRCAEGAKGEYSHPCARIARARVLTLGTVEGPWVYANFAPIATLLNVWPAFTFTVTGGVLTT